MDTTPMTPIEIDTELADIFERQYELNATISRTMDSLHRMVGDTHARNGWDLSSQETRRQAQEIVDGSRAVARGYGRNDADRALASLLFTGKELVALEAKAAPLHGEYERRPWSRFFLAKSQDGHVHSSMGCSTCNREGKSTEFAWQPQMSGKTEAEAVAEYGMSMCTMCFPTAPADPAFKLEPRAKREARETREAAKAERDAAKAAKAITNPDGTPLKLTGRFGDTITTLASAQQSLRDEMFDIHFYGVLYPQNDQSEKETNVEILLAAIAAKTGRDAEDIRTEFDTKAQAKAAKALKN